MNWKDDALAAIEAAHALLKQTRASLPAVFAFAHMMPCAAWIKAPDGTMIWVNRAYELKYGKPLNQYHGNSDASMWGDETAAEFGANDAAAIEAGGAITVVETVTMPSGEERHVRSWKWPVIHRETGQLIGVGGMEITA